MQPGAWHSEQTASSVWGKSGFDRSLEARQGHLEAQSSLISPCLLSVVPTGSVLCVDSPHWTPRRKKEEVWEMMSCLSMKVLSWHILFADFILCENRTESARLYFGIPKDCFHILNENLGKVYGKWINIHPFSPLPWLQDPRTWYKHLVSIKCYANPSWASCIEGFLQRGLLNKKWSNFSPWLVNSGADSFVLRGVQDIPVCAPARSFRQ